MGILKQQQKLLPIALKIVLFFVVNISYAASPNRINLESSANIKFSDKGLKEPSGLTFSHEKTAFWVVSDNQTNIFKIELNGLLKKEDTISHPILKGLEGIAISNDGLCLYVVKEESNTIVLVNIKNKSVESEIFISKLAGFSDMTEKFPDHFKLHFGDAKGLEGITIHPVTGNVFLLKESGLLIEISYHQQKILNYYNLNFADDYSGIAFEQVQQNRLWVVSDKSRMIYLFDLKNAQVVKSYKLKNIRGKSYSSAEGVAYDPEKKELYIVTDSKHKLLKYQVVY